MFVEFLPEEVFEFFFSLCHNLKVAQLIGPIDWIMHEDITDIFELNHLTNLEVLVLSKYKYSDGNKESSTFRSEYCRVQFKKVAHLFKNDSL